MNFENINFAFNTNAFLLIPLLLIAVGYSYFVYKYTIPTISTLIKTILIILRSISLILIILILFEPTIILNYTKTTVPKNLLFIDNSSSIIHKDSLTKSNQVNTFVSEFVNKTNGNKNILTFGEHIDTIKNIDNYKFKFDEHLTNFDNITSYLSRSENISSVTIVSDGIINDGSNSYLNFEKLNIPIFTVAIGDTSQPSDIAIKKVTFNKYVYLNKTTEIKCIILNNNFAGKKVTLLLSNNSGIVTSKRITLNNSGINKVVFDYKPTKLGKERLLLKISTLNGEETDENNSCPFILNVLNDKVKLLLVAGAPSPDLSILKQNLLKNETIKLSEIIQIAPNKFLDNGNNKSKIDSADIIMMLDFPTSFTPQSLLNSIANNLNSKKTPFFYIISKGTDYNKIRKYGNFLPFTIRNFSNKKMLVQPIVETTNTPLIKNKTEWNNLPPIFTNLFNLELKSGTLIIVSGKNRKRKDKIPLIFKSKIASSRSIILNGFNFWKWSLQVDNTTSNLFGQFIDNSIKWLNRNSNDKLAFINTSKDIYSAGETIHFNGSIFDETLTPRNDAIIEISISSNNLKKSVKLSSTENGNYEGNINITEPGNYEYKAKITLDENPDKFIKGKFLITKTNLENINFVLNSNYLKFISNITSGRSFDITNYSKLFDQINNISKNKRKNITIKKQYDIWTNKWTLVFIIFLLTLEWFIRKKKGLL